jgi:hypothetical protein
MQALYRRQNRHNKLQIRVLDATRRAAPAHQPGTIPQICKSRFFQNGNQSVTAP